MVFTKNIWLTEKSYSLKLYTVESWGDGVWNGMDQAFKGCSNLSSVPNENGPQFAPNASLNEMFRDCSALDGNLNMWNLTNVIDISNMFNGAIKFNGDLSDWNVSNVTNMQYLFANASSFNGDISKWDVSMVQFMDFMFKGAKSFNGEIGEWNVSQVQNMNSMFVDADAFNQDISKWDVANVENMANMFRRADVFNQDLNKWDVSKVTNMADMFSGAPAFNGDISAWNVSHVINMNNMFFLCSSFNQDLSGWDVSAVLYMDGMFHSATSFNQPIGSWDMHSVQTTSYMFDFAIAFNQDISGWNTGSLTTMESMFGDTKIFNQNIENWDVSNVVSMKNLFRHALGFNQNIGKWDVTSVVRMEGMLDGCGLSTFNYEATLNGWAAQSVQQNVTLGAEDLTYCSYTAHQSLKNNHYWHILDDRKSCLVRAVPDANGIVYVDSAVAVPGDGSSWGNALQYLSDATVSAQTDLEIKEIHIAKGTYYPTGDKQLPYRDSAFWLMRPGLKVRGGYSYSNGIQAYDTQLYPTILSGDIGKQADASDNSRNVLVIMDIAKGGDSLILDGVTITGGAANLDNDGYGFSGGLSIIRAYAITVISNCQFMGNYGQFSSALAIIGNAAATGGNDLSQLADPQILNCNFIGNKYPASPEEVFFKPLGSPLLLMGAAPFFNHCSFIQNIGLIGGVVTNMNNSRSFFNNCTFKDNSAKLVSVMYNDLSGSAVLVNCLLVGNFNTGFKDVDLSPVIYKGLSNAVIVNLSSSFSSIINTTIANNLAIANPSPDDGPLIFNMAESFISMTNSIVWGNKTNTIMDSHTSTPSKVSYSLIQGIPAAPLNHMQDGLTTQPIFIDTTNGNFQLMSPSPLINGGLNDSLTLTLAPYYSAMVDGGMDLAGNKRIGAGIIDLGPYEVSNDPLPVSLQYFTGEWKSSLGLTALRWKSGVEEIDLDKYVIEKSINGKDFLNVSFMKATGSNSAYEFKTAQEESTAYYRLRSVEANGKFDYSRIVQVVQNRDGNSNGNEMLLYPNPARNFINVIVQENTMLNSSNTLLIYSVAGSLVKSVSLKAGVNKIDISQLSVGLYFGKVGSQKLQFVKE